MMKLVKHIVMVALSFGTLISLQGCLATAVVSGAAVATKVATDPRSAGRQLDDETLEERVAYNLNKDEQLKTESRINVVAYSGQVVLIGQAPDEMTQMLAKDIAVGVEGVKNVYNEIRIGEKIGVAQIAQDSWITTKVKSQLLGNASVKATEVKVISENGEVFLIGNLSDEQANAAAEVARYTKGVKRVIKVIQYVQ